MVRNSLFIKSIRDMKKSLVQFISIFLMAMIAVAIVSGLDSIWKTMQTHTDDMQTITQMADLWVIVPNPTQRDMWKIDQIEEIEAYSKRLVINGDAELPGEPTLRIYAMEKDASVDLPYVVEGQRITKKGASIDASFAQANQLQLGDKIRLKVNKVVVEYIIEEIAYNSEHIFSVKDSTSLIPDPKDFGFIMVDIETLTKALGGSEVYNQIGLKLAQNTDETAIREKLEGIFGDRLIGIIDRKDAKSIDNVQARILQFQTISTVFPVMFFLVTALITLSTMLRLVEEQRNQIGTLKAAGYEKHTILWHYTSYGIYVGSLGAFAGTILGPSVIGKVLLYELKDIYVFPSYTMHLNVKNILLVSGLIIFITGAISSYSSLKLLGESPAELLRTKPPKKGSHIFLERFKRLWSSMRFSSKLIARNISKNKARMAMSILGVMGCSGLIIGAFALKTTMGSLASQTFDYVYSYDQRLTLDRTVTHRFVKSLSLEADFQDMQEDNIQIMTDVGKRKFTKITILPDENPLIRLSDTSGRTIPLPDDGVVMTRKLAQMLELSLGDEFYIHIPDKGDKRVKIVGLSDIVVGQGIYLNYHFWEELGGKYEPKDLLIKWHKEPNQQFLQSNRILGDVSRVQQKLDFQSNMQIVDIAAIMLIVAGSSLALVVIYNMSILNFFERIRDLSTLKVLGFYEREIRNLVIFENLLSTITGILLGIPTGKGIMVLITSGFGDDFSLAGEITLENVLVSATMTLLFMAVVNLIISKKIKQIDMLEALKSIE